MSCLEKKKIALVHEWYDTYGGSERVVEQMLEVFPHADLFALVDFIPDQKRSFIKNKNVTTTFIQHLPFSRKYFRNYLPLFPYAIEQLDLSAYDIIISSSHAVAKGVLTSGEQLHICYCHSPMRYAWDLYHQYIQDNGLKKGIKGFFVKWALHKIRVWDQSGANRVDKYIANSNYIARRINKIYARDAFVIYPPADTITFTPSSIRGDYYFAAARMVPYKKLDLIAEAFSKMPDKKLIIAGNGDQLDIIRSKSRGNVVIKNRLTHDEFIKHMQEARAFVYAADEDFGIVMAEAQAAGVPVIAYRKGGASDIILDEQTGLLFDEQTPDALIHAVAKFETLSFDTAFISEHARQFSASSFQEKLRSYVEESCREFYKLSC
ncbi:MAG: glycosyltransferase [Bacteroidota bacterium]|jgi:glycosyltransferase involved in cell wall biosynthesis